MKSILRRVTLLSFVILIGLIFACGGHKIDSSSRPASEARTSPPIYQDISVLEKPDCSTPVVSIKQGSLCGNSIETSAGRAVNAYLGIPYAESTGGQNRWRAPVPKTEWRGTFNATRLGPSCPQNTDAEHPQSEDCLSINVWTPVKASDSPRAVMVFIYGGAFVYGSNGDPMYNGAYTAAVGDVVVVSMNYRLGALGFLAGLKDKKTGEEINGNFGLLDQLLALKWVRENIGAFGGDPDKVTVYGESAGAMSVGIHLVSPKSRGLFRAGIMESNPYGLPYKNLKQAKSIAERFAGNLGCPEDDIACMRGKLPEVVLDAQKQRDMVWPAVFHGIRDFLAWSPFIDGEVLSGQPFEAVSRGETTLPLILGTNGNEALLFVEMAKTALKRKSLSDLDYRLTVDFIFRDRDVREKIYKKYPPDGGDNTSVISRVITEYLFTCPNFFVASHASSNNWSYLFYHVPSFNIWPQVHACADAVCHGDELAFVFHSAAERGYSFTLQENLLSDLMIEYWTNFSKGLDPNRYGDAWPEYGVGSLNLVFVTPVEDIELGADRGADCEFWDEIGYNLPGSFWGIF